LHSDEIFTIRKAVCQQLSERLTNVYGDSAPSYATITRCVAEFKRG